jgi:hypothetical protein
MVEDGSNEGVEELLAKLSPKWRAFVFEYVKDFNGAAAARRAGYAAKSARNTAWKLLRDPGVKAAIEAHLDEYAMSAAECVKHLADWGRGTMGPFLDDHGHTDLTSEKAKAHIKLVKKITETRRYIKDEDGEDVLEVKLALELHDAKDAVKETLRMHGKIVDRVEVGVDADAATIAALLGVRLEDDGGDDGEDLEGFDDELGLGD